MFVQNVHSAHRYNKTRVQLITAVYACINYSRATEELKYPSSRRTPTKYPMSTMDKKYWCSCNSSQHLWYQHVTSEQFRISRLLYSHDLTLSRPLSINFCSDRLTPSLSRSTSRTVSPDRVLNFFLKYEQRTC